MFEPVGELLVDLSLFGGECSGRFGWWELWVCWQIGGCDSLDLLFPEIERFVIFDGRLFEGDEVSVGEPGSWGEALWRIGLFGGVEGEQFGEQRGDGPSIEYGVVEGESEVEGFGGESMDVDSSERCVVPVEAVLFLLFGEQFEGLSACLFVEIGEIVDLQWDGSLFGDEL